MEGEGGKKENVKVKMGGRRGKNEGNKIRAKLEEEECLVSKIQEKKMSKRKCSAEKTPKKDSPVFLYRQQKS